MIPPHDYVSIYHTWNGTMSWKGDKNDCKRLYAEFIKNPTGKSCDTFNNKLNATQLKLFQEGFCIIFILPPRPAWDRLWDKATEEQRDKLMDFIKPLLGKDHLITAWDVHFKRIDKKLNNSYAVIGIESFMDTPFDKKYMRAGNIIMTNKGNILGTNLNVDTCINLFKVIYR